MDWKVILLVLATGCAVINTKVVSPADILILLDSTNNARSNNFKIETNFTINLIRSIYSQGIRLGIYTFGENTHAQIGLNADHSEQELVQAATYMWYSTGHGNVAPAIKYAVEHGFQDSAADRECVPRIMIILTHSAINTQSVALELRTLLNIKHVQAFVLNMAGATAAANFATLTESSSRVLDVADFAQLGAIPAELTHKMSSDLPSTGCGTLTQWQAWTKCTASCGQGLKFRVRTCQKAKETDTDCQDDLAEDSICHAQACTDPVDGSWANWNAWGICTKTCGTGRQRRTRACAAPIPRLGGKPCPGAKQQQRDCSEWNCPVCTTPCPAGGRLSKDCQTCECSSSTLFGQILDNAGGPVTDADIFISSKRYKSIAQTGELGHFNVSNICLEFEQIYLTANLHESKILDPTPVNSTHWTINATLERYAQKVGIIWTIGQSNIGVIKSASKTAVVNSICTKTVAYNEMVVLSNAQDAIPPALVQAPPVFNVHPHDKSRMEGQSFSLCCSAVGIPSPVKYIWLKDDIQLENFGTNGTLFISAASHSDSGTYKCITETVAGVSQSDEAILIISDFATDTCGAPVAKLEDLPPGCFLTGDATKRSSIDVGTCGGAKCMTSSLRDNGTCTDWWPHYCCDTKDVQSLDVACDGFSFKTARVKTCECKLCTLRTVIAGRALGRNNSREIPMRLGNVLVNGQKVAQTSMVGFFQFNVPVGTKRVVATFRDTVFKKFMDITKIIDVAEGEEIFDIVNIPLKPKSISLNTNNSTNIPLGADEHGQAPLSSLVIQKDSLVGSDGQIHRGPAKATVKFIDPRNPDDLESANGEFECESPDGEKKPLRTYGMFHFEVEDEHGKPLHMYKPMEIYMDSSSFNISLDSNGSPDLAMWDYDTNKGIWVERARFRFSKSQGGMRKLLQSNSMIEADLNITPMTEYEQTTYHAENRLTGYRTVSLFRYWWGRWHNVDRKEPIYQSVTVKDPPKLRDGVCFVGVSIFTDMTLTKLHSTSDRSIIITAYSQQKSGNDPKPYLGIKKERRLVNGRACLMVFCRQLVYIKVETGDGERLIAAKHVLPNLYPIVSTINNTVKFESMDFGSSYDCGSPSCNCKTPPCSGPMYPYGQRSSCASATTDNSFHFNFAFFTKPPQHSYAVGSSDVYDKPLSWYPSSPDKLIYKSCFIKVLLKVYNTFDIRVVATSYLDRFGGQSFGTHVVGPTPKPSSLDYTVRAACMEYRCPGYFRNGSIERFNQSTAVQINLQTSNTSLSCRTRVGHAPLQPNVRAISNHTGVQFMSNAGDNFGSSYGVYINNDHKKDVERFCNAGRDQGLHIDPVMDPTKNYAIEFDCLN